MLKINKTLQRVKYVAPCLYPYCQHPLTLVSPSPIFPPLLALSASYNNLNDSAKKMLESAAGNRVKLQL